MRVFRTFFFIWAVSILSAQMAYAVTPTEVLDGFKKEASNTSGFQGFSSERGAIFYKAKHKHDLSCSTCHTDNPSAEGKHSETDKLIKPLAPAANEERFTDMKKVEKWFKRNCNDVLDRECTVQEKGDLLAYLLTVKK